MPELKGECENKYEPLRFEGQIIWTSFLFGLRSRDGHTGSGGDCLRCEGEQLCLRKWKTREFSTTC